jgi:septal ring factor EnvC (AmiA/AmiB activator)
MSNNNDNLNEAIAILQTMNMEDCAMAIQDLQHELERVKGIAYRRLDRIAQLQHDVAVLEDKLEDTRSDLKLEQGHRLAQQQRAGRLALELAQLEDDPRYLEDELPKLEDTRSDLNASERKVELLTKLAENRLERIFNLLGAIDSPNPAIAKDNELAHDADELVEELLGVEHDDAESRLC